MTLSTDEKIAVLNDVISLSDQAIKCLLTGNLSDFQKDIVLAQRGLDFIFVSLTEEVKEKRTAMYIDQNGTSIKCGYVIGFRNRVYEDGKWINVLESHWVSFSKVEVMAI